MSPLGFDIFFKWSGTREKNLNVRIHFLLKTILLLKWKLFSFNEKILNCALLKISLLPEAVTGGVHDILMSYELWDIIFTSCIYSTSFKLLLSFKSYFYCTNASYFFACYFQVTVFWVTTYCLSYEWIFISELRAIINCTSYELPFIARNFLTLIIISLGKNLGLDKPRFYVVNT